MLDGSEAESVRNELSGESGNAVQAGVVYGGIRFGGADGRPAPVPRQLPMDVPAFVDRAPYLNMLDSLLDRGTGGGGDHGVVISAIAGPPGVGKTALALHWAHRVRHRYADGDLYVDMRGHGSGNRLDAGQVLDGFLRALDVPPQRIPADTEGRSALFRSLLSGRRMLIVIDDAAGSGQVRPLLPSSPRCLVIVTSRNVLSGLIARDGATRMVLDILPPEESVELLKRIVGAERIAAEPESAGRLAEMCAHLPLALRIMAERINSRPFATLAELVEQLEDERARLDALGFEDDELSDVRAVFSSSYRALPEPAARLFRLLGLHPGAEVSTAAAAALAGTETSTVRRLLDTLTGASLLQPVAAGRFRLHDLLRLYAAECAERDEPREDRARAVHRVLSWYLRTVATAHRVILPAFHDVPMDGYGHDVRPLAFETVDEAMAWFEQERLNLIDALRFALRTGHYGIAWRLPAVMYGFFELRSHWSEWPGIHRLGLEAAKKAGDPYGEACNHLGLGDAHWLLGRLPEARECYERAARLGGKVRDGWIEGFALRQIGTVLCQQEQVDQAVAVTRRAIEVFRAYGEKRGEGMALLSLANCHRALERYDEELRDCLAALAIFAELGDEWSVAWGRHMAGRAYGDTGDHRQAVDAHRRAREAFRRFGDRRNELLCLVGVAEALDAVGDDGARAHWEQAAHLAGALDESATADVLGRITAALRAHTDGREERSG
ncbi:MAG TPA: tetratricopeptide repeat protein [Streptomyces sp.]|uniref:ATP-binding protein n=1 Tax=Streptomyces sp. TaxID=1931 RepID=UPI002D321DC2|nr:tetratricopeptide repeat protein [Streptomyces sp.]HZG02545.1 tetratricopeptide repeat protein [Streptomyces sp.]